jgi:triphosphoribosyl-dephospho-CoA synthase
MSMLSSNTIESCVIWACENEVAAPKPGNVNDFSDGHNMEVQDFIKSAHAIAPIMAQKALSVGELILQGIQATRTVVNCNTNLGIVLLFAPLCRAIHQCSDFKQLPDELEKVLHNLTVDDAKACYEAIRLADAGGLGSSEQQDIDAIPSVTLLQAMRIAEERDSIAKQYVTNYKDILNFGLPILTSSIKSGESVEWATAFAYLKFLASVPDTLIRRKQSWEHALEITKAAIKILTKVNENNMLSSFEAEIITWDNELKKKAINPGTTADLIAATLLIYAFQQALSSNSISVS